jgi:hypothetical protein
MALSTPGSGVRREAKDGLFVVVGPFTTKECRRWTIHDKRDREVSPRQSHSPPEATVVSALLVGGLADEPA